jgi:hypothetical protein
VKRGSRGQCEQRVDLGLTGIHRDVLGLPFGIDLRQEALGFGSVLGSGHTLDPGPADLADLPRWYLASLDRTLDVLGSAGPGSRTWTFSSTGDRRVGWWDRRLAVEVIIHRWDAGDAVAADGGPSPDPPDGDVAAAGIEEFMIEFLPGLLAQEITRELSGTLHLHTTDGPTEWWIDLEAAGRPCPGTSKRTQPSAAPAPTFCCG